MKKNKYTSLLKNTTLLSFGLFGAKFVQFILLPYFTNILTPEEYGTIDLILTFISLMVPVVTMNLADAVLRFGLSKNEKKEEVLNAAIFILLVASAVTLIISIVFRFYEVTNLWKNYIVCIIILQCFRINISLYIKAEEKIEIYSTDTILYAIVIAGCDILFLSFYKMGIKGYFLAEIVGNFFSVLYLASRGKIICRIDLFRKHNFVLIKAMLKYSFPLMFNAVSWWIMSFSDRFILNIFYSESEVGIYSVAAKMPAIVTTVLSVFTQAWIMSSVVEFESGKDIKFFKRVFNYYSGILLIIISIAILLVQPFMKIYVGNSFGISWKYVPFLLIGTFYLGLSNYFGAFYSAAKKNIKEVLTTLSGAGSNIVLNFILIPKYGIMGAVFATMLSYVLIAIVRIYDTKSILNIHISLLLLLENMVLLFLQTLCIVYLKNYYLAIICVCLVIYINLKIIVTEMCSKV